MSRIIVVGCTCSGKTTLAKKLQKKYNIDLISLDDYYFNYDGSPKELGDWIKIVEKVSSRENWIIEGHYTNVLKLISLKADKCYFMNISRTKCLNNLLNRTISSIFTNRNLTVINKQKYLYIYIWRVKRLFSLFWAIITFDRKKKAIYISHIKSNTNIEFHSITY